MNKNIRRSIVIAAGVTGAALITEAAHGTLETDAAAWNAAHTALEAAGATDVAALAAERDKWKADAEAFGNQAGVLPTSSEKVGADVSEQGTDEYAKAIDGLAHNQALKGHPVFG